MSFAALRSPTWRRTPPWREPVEGGYQRPDPALWTPQLLPGLRALYDAELGQPKHVGYVQLDGTSGDYIYTPDSAATSFDNDIEVVMRVRVTDWSAAAIQTLVGKYLPTGNQRSWRFYTNTAGNIGLTASADGTSVTTVTVTPTNPLPDDTWIWIRPRLDLTNGANSVGTIDTAADTGSNALVPISWTANGSATGATIAGVFDGTGSTEIGSFTNGTAERLSGRLGRCIVKSGFDGTTVADFNADDCYGDGYWHADGYRWNLGLPKIYDRGPNGLAPATFGSGSNQPKWLPWESRSQVALPGSSGNSVSAPHVTHTGDFVARVQVKFDAATASFSQLIGDRSGGSTAEAQFRFAGSSALLSLQWFESGVQTDVGTAASIHGLLDGQVAWLGVERINNNGGVYRVRFYKSIDDSPSLTDWTGWTLISEHNGAVPAAPTVTTNIVSLGGPNNPLTGSVMRAVAFNNGVQTIDFVAASCGQSGYTDTLGNVWAVNRATTGRKTVVQSPAARSARSVILFGTDDWASAPAAAAPPLGLSDNATVTAAVRQHATAAAFRWYWAITSGVGTELMSMQQRTTNFCKSVFSDGVNTIDSSPLPAFTNGTMTVVGARVEARTAYAAYLNGGSPATQSPAAVGALTPAAFTIGALAPASAVQEFEFGALLVRTVAESDTEHGLQVAYYGGGL